MKLRRAVWSILLILNSGADLPATPPQLSQVLPLAVAPGRTAHLALRGEHLQEPHRLWSTFPQRCVFDSPADESSQQGDELTAHLTLPRDVQVGIAAIRAVTNQGVSNPLLIMVDDIPSTAETSDNHGPENAQALNWPIAVDGHSDAVQEDWFRIDVTSGERLSMEVVAQRLGSRLDPVLRLIDTEGSEIARVDDSPSVGGDCRFAHTFEAGGEYFLAVRDVRYAGGGDHRYRLRVGKFPLVSCVFPAGGKCGTVGSFEFVGADADLNTPVHVTLPQEYGTSRLVSFGVASPDSLGSGWFQVEVGRHDEFIEQEPHDDPQLATPIELPCAINGRLSQPGDIDRFRFAAKKGQRLHAVAVTRELGSPCDLFLSLLKGDGTQIAVARQEKRTILTAEMPEDGDYILLIENLLSGSNGQYVYRVDLTEQYAGFSLQAEHPQYSSPQAGTFVVKVNAKRHGFRGPIELALRDVRDGSMQYEDLSQKMTLDGNRLDGDETLLKITLNDDIRQGEMHLLQIVGKAEVDGQTVTVSARQYDPLAALLPNVLSYPAPLTDTIAVGVGPPFPPFFELKVASQPVYFPQLVGASSFDVEINRTNDGFKDSITLNVEDLPEGVQAEIAPIEDGDKAYRVTLTGPPDLALGESRIRIAGTGTFQEQTRTVELKDVPLRITKPLVVSANLEGILEPGGRQVARVQVQRFGEDRKPIRVQVSDGPPGVYALIYVTIPSNSDQAAITLSAATDAAPGEYNNLVVVASTVVQGETISVRSDPAVVKIGQRPAPSGTVEE